MSTKEQFVRVVGGGWRVEQESRRSAVHVLYRRSQMNLGNCPSNGRFQKQRELPFTLLTTLAPLLGHQKKVQSHCAWLLSGFLKKALTSSPSVYINSTAVLISFRRTAESQRNWGQFRESRHLRTPSTRHYKIRPLSDQSWELHKCAHVCINIKKRVWRHGHLEKHQWVLSWGLHLSSLAWHFCYGAYFKSTQHSSWSSPKTTLPL